MKSLKFKKLRFFLDLEETVIASWEEFYFLMNCDRIANKIARLIQTYLPEHCPADMYPTATLDSAQLKTFFNKMVEKGLVEFHVFSYAIHNSDDVDFFNKNIRELVEKALSLHFDDKVFTAREAQVIAFGGTTVVDLLSSRFAFDKTVTFKPFIENNFNNANGEAFFLIDDTVCDSVVNFGNKKRPYQELNSVFLLNVNNI